MKTFFAYLSCGLLYLIIVALSHNAQATTIVDRNNPGAIICSKFAKEHGAIDAPGRFATFATWQDGVAAHKALLASYMERGYNTVRKIVSRYAPPKENHTQAYIRKVAYALNVKPNQPLSDDKLDKLQEVIASIETGE
jgi:hypothetical protein